MQTPKGLYALLAFMSCLWSCVGVRGEEIVQPVHLSVLPVHLSLEITKADADTLVLQGWSQHGIAAKFRVDDTYSILIKTTVVLLKQGESVLLELELYEKEKLILSPTWLPKDGEGITFVLSAVPDPKHPAIVRAAAILSQIFVRPTILRG